VRVVVAPDKFKGSLSAVDAATAMRLGVLDVLPDAEVECLPVADGGEGTVEAFVMAGAAAREVTVRGPLGDSVRASLAVRGDVAIIEAAQACGLGLVDHPGPDTALAADTIGVADLVLDAAAAGAVQVVIGLGGSASTDGGSGLARGLGVIMSDAAGRPLPPGGGSLVRLDRIDTSSLIARGLRVVAASDVQAPLVGERGAARTYAAQKGAGPDEIALLEKGLLRWAELVDRDVGRSIAGLPGGGAAGGLAAGAVAFLDAEIVSGVDVVLDLLGFADAVAGADLVLTGEGSFDSQSLDGKAPVGVARRAGVADVPTWVIGGRAAVTRSELDSAGIAGCLALTDVAAPALAISGAASLLRRRTADAVQMWRTGRT
jgi:glycerate kinase